MSKVDLRSHLAEDSSASSSMRDRSAWESKESKGSTMIEDGK